MLPEYPLTDEHSPVTCAIYCAVLTSENKKFEKHDSYNVNINSDSLGGRQNPRISYFRYNLNRINARGRQK